MSFEIRLRVLQDGGVRCEPGPGVPAGEFVIAGEDDGNRVTLSVSQRDAAGRFVASAHHVRDRAEEALVAAEKAVEAGADVAAVALEGSAAGDNEAAH